MRNDPGSPSAARSHSVAGLLVACVLVAVLYPVGNAQTPQKSVLVLIAARRNAPWTTVQDNTIRTVLYNGLAGHLDYYAEYLDVMRFPEPDYQLAVRDFLRRKYAGQTFDVVVANTNAMADFVKTYRDELFPGVAVVFIATSPRSEPKSTGVVTVLDLKSTIDIAIQLHPDLREVFVVSGASDGDRFYENLARAQFRAFDGRIGFTYATGLALPELLRRVAALPPHTIIYPLTFFEDGNGSKFVGDEVIDQIVSVANVPTYHWFDGVVDHGVVGGSVLSVEGVARDIANVALRVLKGESPESIPVREIDPNIIYFDWRQLRRWGISEARLPAGSLVRFRQPSLWDQYKFYVVGATSVLALQAALIAGLLVQRVRRRRVESALLDSEAALRQSYEQTQDLAGRLITAQEAERSRIGRDLHDDVCQRLAVLAMMLSGLKHRLSGSTPQPDLEGVVTTLQERTSTLATDVRNLSHDLHPSVLEHAGLVPVLKAHCDEFARQQNVDVTFSADEGVGSVDGAAALCVYRVTQEALTNAGKHASATAVRVRLSRTAEAIELEVVDDGIGFESGWHTPSGLGLRSIDERVRFNKGTARVESHPGQGTSVFVRVPLSPAATRNPVDRC